MSPFATCLSSVLTDYLAFRDASVRRTSDALQKAIRDWIDAAERIKKKNQTFGVSFNPFAQIKIGETTHSRILGNLMNPHGSHGQEALFLKIFLEELGHPDPSSGEWQVTVETGRVDILIWRNSPLKSAVIIENKSNYADDQPNQIYRYWHQEMYLWDRNLWDLKHETSVQQRNQHFFVVYLPADGGKSPDSHSMERPEDWTDARNPHPRVPPLNCKTISLPELTGLWLDKAFPKIPETNTRLRDFITQYHELWNP